MTNIIRVIDLETSAMELPAAQVVEVGVCDLTGPLSDGWAVFEPKSYLCGGVTAMEPGARAAHHITVAEIAGLEPFSARHVFAQADEDGVVIFAAHNAEFEAKFISPPVPMICTYKAALRVWPAAQSHSNGALRYWLEDQGLIELDPAKAQPAHRAGPDAYVTAHILAALLKLTTAKQMAAWTKEPRLLPTCPIGKFRGKPWADVDTGFLNWMLKQADMESDLKWNANHELNRRAGHSA